MSNHTSIEEGIYSSSSLSTHMGCPRKFYWRYVRQVEKRGEERTAASFGKVFHDVLKVWYKSGVVEEAVKGFQQLPQTMDDDHRTREFGEAVMKEYVRRYSKEVGETLHLEVRGNLEIGSRMYVFVIDRIERWNQAVYVDDHKTTKYLGTSFFGQFRPNPQMDGYAWATRELVGECNGVVINGISVARNPKERFQRFISPRSKEEMDKFPTQFTEEVEDIERNYARGVWPQRTTWCHQYFVDCEYCPLCIYQAAPHIESEERERVVEVSYQPIVREEESINSNEGGEK
jgi:hypothetical protein